MEKFSFLKFFGSFFQVLPWIKTIRILLGILGISFIGLTIYRAYFMPTKKEITHIVAETGSHVTYQVKKEKEGISVSPFVEGYGFAETDKRVGAGVRAGVRIDF